MRLLGQPLDWLIFIVERSNRRCDVLLYRGSRRGSKQYGRRGGKIEAPIKDEDIDVILKMPANKLKDWNDLAENLGKKLGQNVKAHQIRKVFNDILTIREDAEKEKADVNELKRRLKLVEVRLAYTAARIGG
ncbi:MAG: type III-A CRISPR-associated protein Csm2, partial [Candidatus Asgardarchaeia archaeon]